MPFRMSGLLLVRLASTTLISSRNLFGTLAAEVAGTLHGSPACTGSTVR